jgi:hypothetical protein
MRDLTPDMATEIAKPKLNPVVFCYAEFLTGPIYLWSGVGIVAWNGQTWSGVGMLGSISAVKETSDLLATNLVLSLAGIPSDLLGDAITEVRQGKQVVIWLGVMDDNLNVIADPYEAFSGRMDIAVVDEGAETSSISITVENVLVDLQRARPVPFTDQGQQTEFPGDKGFEYVPQLQEKSITWGVAGASVGSTGGDGGVPSTGLGVPKQPFMPI